MFFLTAVHVDLADKFCTDSDTQDMYALDGEEISHADFKLGEFVMTLPEFADQFKMVDGAYQNAVGEQQICKQNLATAIKGYKNPAVQIGKSK